MLQVMFWVLSALVYAGSNEQRKLQNFIRMQEEFETRGENDKILQKSDDFLRVVTWNVGVFENIDRSEGITTFFNYHAQHRKSYKKFLSKNIIKLLDADVYIFNEWPFLKMKESVGDVLKPIPVLENFMETNGYRLVEYCGHSRWRSGNAIFVNNRIKSESSGVVVMAQNINSIRCIAKVEVMFKNNRVKIFSTHLDNEKSAVRNQQFEQVLKKEIEGENMLIIGGDFNERFNDDTVKSIAKTLHDTVSYSTKHSHKSMSTIDFIFNTRDLTCLASNLYHTSISDHIPVIKDFIITPSKPSPSTYPQILVENLDDPNDKNQTSNTKEELEQSIIVAPSQNTETPVDHCIDLDPIEETTETMG